MDQQRPRTLIIGWDGATFDLIGPWIKAGRLPNLDRLMSQGVHGRLPAWPNTNSASAWSSIVTGYNAGRHGIYDFGSMPQRGQRWRAITAADRRQPSLWRRLSDAGQCVGAINVPISYPADRVNGFVLSGMDSPGTHSPGFCQPPGLYAELRRTGIRYEIDVPRLAPYRERDPYHVPDIVRRLVEARAKALLRLLHAYPWDTVMAVFTATDRMQHHYWLDAPVTDGNPGWNAVRSLYQMLDEWLGRCIELAGPSAAIMVISDHGFGPARGAKLALPTLLETLGLMRRSRTEPRKRGLVAPYLMDVGRRVLPPSLQLRLAQAWPSLRLRLLDERSFAGVIWRESKVFTDRPGDFVYVNLQGRQPEGAVPPEEYEAVRRRVREVLLDVTDPVSGRRLVRAVHDRESVFHGPCIGEAPDLVIEWEEDALGEELRYQAGGHSIVVGPPPRSAAGKGWQGTHRNEGIFVACGPGIRPGTTLTSGHQYDITPTVLHLQGQPVPDDMDGRVLTEMFTEEWLRAHPVRRAAPSGEGQIPGAGSALDATEQGQVEARLRDLGYIE